MDILYWHWWVLGLVLVVAEMLSPTGFFLLWIGAAAILKAEGERQAQILAAEAQKQEQILEAEGRKEAAFRDAEARERQAEAEAKATTMVSQAIAKGDVQALNYFVATKYVEAVARVATSPNEKLVLMPLEAGSVIGAIGGIAELAKKAGAAGARPAGA